MRLRISAFFAAVLAMAFLFPACSNEQEDWEGAVYIEANWEGSNCVDWSVAPTSDGIPWEPTIKQQKFQSVLKKVVADNRFLDVKLNDVWVTWKRIDGGTKLPHPYHAVYDVLVPAGGTAMFNNGSVIAGEQLLEAPFDVLYPENGGVDPETGKTFIALEATVTWYGETYNGDKVKTSLRLIETFRYGSGCTN